MVVLVIVATTASPISRVLTFFVPSDQMSAVRSPCASTLCTAVSFAHLPFQGRHFGQVRLWGTIGWVVSGWLIGYWLGGPVRLGGWLARALLVVLGPVAAAFVHLLLSPKREYAADSVAASRQSPLTTSVVRATRGLRNSGRRAKQRTRCPFRSSASRRRLRKRGRR